MKIVVVNEQDVIIGSKNRNEELPDDITRVSGLWVFNSQRQSLLAQRAFDKKYSPGKWGPAVAGTVEEGETYLSNIIKEAKEELGIDLAEQDIIVGKKEFVAAEHKYFRQYYLAKLDLPLNAFTIQAEEVEQIKWVGLQELDEWIRRSPEDFTPSLADAFQECKMIFNNLKL